MEKKTKMVLILAIVITVTVVILIMIVAGSGWYYLYGSSKSATGWCQGTIEHYFETFYKAEDRRQQFQRKLHFINSKERNQKLQRQQQQQCLMQPLRYL